MRDITSWSPRCSPPAKLVKPVRLDRTGLTGPTRGQARSKQWRGLGHGYYVARHADGSIPEQRILEAAARLPDGGVVTGWAACRWRGAGYFDGLGPDGRTQLPVSLVVGPRHNPRPRPGITSMRDQIAPDDITVVRGLPCTTAERALFDEMRTARDVREAVVAMEMMAAAELTSIGRMSTYCATQAGRNGLPLVIAALDLAVEDSRSPTETRMRLVWVLDAGLPRPLANRPVFDLHENLVGIADLLDPVAGVVGEYDGAAHRAARRHRRDVRREDLFRRVGLEYFKIVGADLLDLDLAVDRMITTRRRAPFLSAGRRRWTLVPPEGWYDSPLDALPLDERLAYREWLHPEP
jgi:hypothetical protein